VTYGFGGMCADFGPLGIQVNGLGPGYFATELTAALVADPSSPRGWNGVQPRAAAVASKSSVERSCSSQARVSYVNGHIVYVDGAMTAVVLYGMLRHVIRSTGVDRRGVRERSRPVASIQRQAICAPPASALRPSIAPTAHLTDHAFVR